MCLGALGRKHSGCGSEITFSVFTLYFSFGLMCLKSKRELSGHKNKGDPLSVFKILDSFKKLPRLKKQVKKIEISHGLKTHTTDDKGQ